MKERTLFLFLVLSALGLVLSIAAHVLSLAGLPLPGGQLVWGLHLGIFVVWIPVVFISRALNQNGNRKDFWKVALAGCPPWMRRAMYLLFGYVILNFVLFIATAPKRPQKIPGSAPPSVVRGFSGHWMIFYGAAFTLLYSRLHAPHLYRPRTCPNGHEVAPTARFCGVCGHELSADPAQTSTDPGA